MECGTLKSYSEVNRHPNGKRRLTTVESVLHSICCADNISWKEAFRKLIHSCARQGTMPDDRHSIRDMLSECGFFLQAGSYANRPVIDIIQECNEIFHNGEQVIVNLSDSPSYGLYMPILPVKNNGVLHYELQFPLDWQKDVGSEVWIRWADRQNHSIAPRKNTTRTAKKKEISAKDSDALFVFNENPTDNLVGDCAVRAIAGVLEITWEEAAWKLVEAGNYVCTCINLTTNIEECLKKEGFEKHGPIYRNGHMLNGREFCELIHDMFPSGTKIYAHPGHSHAVAILVFEGDYKIVDTWDSTSRPIVNYWAKYPEQKQRQKPSERNKQATPQKITELLVGNKIIHRAYGVGKVTVIANSIATVLFENGSEKKLSVDWITANCKPSL